MTIYIKDGKVVEHADNPDATSGEEMTIDFYRQRMKLFLRRARLTVNILTFLDLGYLDEIQLLAEIASNCQFYDNGAIWTTRVGDFAKFVQHLREFVVKEETYKYFIKEIGGLEKLIKDGHLIWLVGDDGEDELHFHPKYFAVADGESITPPKLQRANFNTHDLKPSAEWDKSEEDDWDAYDPELDYDYDPDYDEDDYGDDYDYDEHEY